MRKKAAKVLAIIGAILVGVLLCLNFEFLAKYHYVESIYNYFSAEIITYRNLDRNLQILNHKRIPDLLKKFSHEELKMLKNSRAIFLDAKEVLQLSARGKMINGEIGVLINTPSAYRGLKRAQQIAYNSLVTEAALKIGVKVIVDCSIPDLSRLTPKGLRLVQRLKQKKIIRLVIVDGGHHLPAFSLEPELIILPVLKGKNNVAYTSHPLLQDAMSIKKVKMALGDVSPKTVIITAPRFLVLKTKGPIIEMVKQVLKKLNMVYSEEIHHIAKKQSIRTARFLPPDIYDAGTIIKNSTALMHIDLRNEQDLRKTIKKIEGVYAVFRIKKIYLSFGYGKQPWYLIRQKNLIEKDVAKIISSFPNIDIQIVTIPYATLSLFFLR